MFSEHVYYISNNEKRKEVMTLTPEFKQFMDNMWAQELVINGKKVVDRTVGFGALPDITLTLEDGTFLSAKELFKNVSKTS